MTADELPELKYIEYCEYHCMRWDYCDCIHVQSYYASEKSVKARETAIAERLKEHKKNLETGIISFIDLNKLIEELTREK